MKTNKPYLLELQRNLFPSHSGDAKVKNGPKQIIGNMSSHTARFVLAVGAALCFTIPSAKAGIEGDLVVWNQVDIKQEIIINGVSKGFVDRGIKDNPTKKNFPVGDTLAAVTTVQAKASEGLFKGVTWTQKIKGEARDYIFQVRAFAND